MLLARSASGELAPALPPTTGEAPVLYAFDAANLAQGLYTQNPPSPFLRAKKIKGLEDIWEASVAMSYCITYPIQGDTLILRRIGTHDILRREDART